MILGLTSDKYDRPTLYDEASTVMAQKLSQIEGVGQVSVGGGAGPSVRVEVNPTLLNSYGLTLPNIQSVLSLQNAHEPTGQLSNGITTEDIVVNDQITLADQYKPLIVGYHKGAAVRLSDVAAVSNAAQNIRAAGYLNGVPSIPIIIFRQPGANIIDTVDRIKAAMPSIEASIPQGIKTTIAQDRTTTIRASVNDVERTLILSIVLVVLVVFIFLRNGRATLIPAVAVPTSLIGTFAVMYLLGFSIDNLSLMALTISTGFVVDDAIVVMENITRHREAGMHPFAAALLGSKEIGFTVFSISMSLIAVFIPILLMAGIVGRLFREFAITLSTAIIVSMVISLTTTPMMCAYLLKDESKMEHGRVYRVTERGFAWMVSVYSRSLAWVLKHPWPVFAILLLTIALNIYLMYTIHSGFFPQQDTGILTGSVQGPQDASFPVMDNSVLKLEDAVKADPAVQNVIAFTGGNGATNGGSLFITLKPLGGQCTESATCPVRHTGAPEIINRLRPKLNRLPVARATLQAAQDLRIGGRMGGALYQYTIQSDNVQDLTQWGPKLLAGMTKLPGFQDVNTDAQNSGLQELLTYDRPTAARLGITPQSLDSSIYSAFGQSEVSIMYTQLNQYYVVMEVAPPYWQSPEGLKNIYLNSTGSGVIPLSAVSTAQATTTPLTVNHTSSFPSVTVSFNLATNMSLSDAVREVSEMQQQMNMPQTVRGFFAGTAAAYQVSWNSVPLLMGLAILAVYIVLGILYESLVHPLTIISTLPSASVGAMLALMLFKIDLNMISIIGIILLIGIVKKNAIMMIDFALVAEREHGKTTTEAIFEACQLRFRPILMTTMAALFGALPLAFGTGTGSELRRPLGITIVGGLIVSQMLTLYTTPVVYILFDWARLKVRGKQPETLQHGTAEAT
jgi:multidrug efflux pump